MHLYQNRVGLFLVSGQTWGQQFYCTCPPLYTSFYAEFNGESMNNELIFLCISANDIVRI